MIETRASQAKKQDKPAEPKSADVEMKPVETKEDLDGAIVMEITQNISLVERAVSTLESRFSTRAIRATSSIRHKLRPDILLSALNLLGDSTIKTSLAKSLKATSANLPDVVTSPESAVYVGYLIIMYYFDKKEYARGLELSKELISQIVRLNLRTMDQIAARHYFYLAQFYELTGQSDSIHAHLLGSYRTAVLRQDTETQATLLNSLLKYFLSLNLIDQADKLVSKTTFPPTAGNNQLARYLYFLDYSVSHQNLQQAIRKAPFNETSAGFQEAAHKLSIIVQLLMGEIPERSIFRQPLLNKVLIPYFKITQAVREGDLGKFQETLAANTAVFREDRTYTLIVRLRHNVIKAGIRRISLAYSRISLKDICLKLQLDSEEDAEFIVAKAIRDGVIDATIDHEKGSVSSKENVDIYSTNEPQNAFHQRISFCLSLYNESVKAMRYPHDAHKKELEKASELLEQERLLAKEIIDEMDEGDE